MKYQVVIAELAIMVHANLDVSEKAVKEQAKLIIGSQGMLSQQVTISKCKPVYLGRGVWRVFLNDINVGPPVEVPEMADREEQSKRAIDIAIGRLGLSYREAFKAIPVKD